MAFFGENDDGYESVSDNLQQEYQQQASQEEVRLQNEEELKKQQEQEEAEATKQEEIEEETQRNRDASEKTAEHEKVLQENSGARVNSIEDLVQGDPNNLEGDLQGIIAKLAKTGVESEKSNSRGAGIKGVARQDRGSVMTGPDGEDSNEPSTSGDDHGASR